MAYLRHLLAAGSGSCLAPAIKGLLPVALLLQALGNTVNDLGRPAARTLVQDLNASDLQLGESSCVSAQEQPLPPSSTEGQDAVEEISLIHLGAVLTRGPSHQQPHLAIARPTGDHAATPSAAAVSSPWPATTVVPPPVAHRPPRSMLPEAVVMPAVTAPPPLISHPQLASMKGTLPRSPHVNAWDRFRGLGPLLDSIPKTTRWRRWHEHEHHQKSGFLKLLTSVEFIEWFILALALICFLLLYRYLNLVPSARCSHGCTLIIWMAAAGAYNTVIWLRLGRQQGTDWLVGYIQELIFSMENVFIYHIIVKSFWMPKGNTRKALVIVVCCQIGFQLLLFMGLARFLGSIPCLPYVLGAWLVYVGMATLWEPDDNDTPENGEEKMPWIGSYFESVLGRRFLPYYLEDARIFQYDAQIGLCCTMLAPATISVLVVDFVMEIDVTLTKIEGIPNHFVAFSSSMAAAFAVPELFFIASDLFRRFFLLKYGITFVLIFFGLQLLLGNWIEISDMLGIVIILGVMALFMVLSAILYTHRPGGRNISASASGDAFEASPATSRRHEL